MKIRNLYILMVSVIVSVSIIAGPAWAGNTQRNRWEGIAIGLGAAILGKVILDQAVSSRTSPEAAYHHRSRWKPSYRRPHKPRGHWETRKVWVPPVYRRVWNPGHYNGKGHWVSGRWIKIEKEPGYWDVERVWVSRRSHGRKGFRY